MGRYGKKSYESKIKRQLKVRFHEQERLVIDEVTREYYDDKDKRISHYAFLLASKKMRGIFMSIKRDFARQRIPFGALNEYHEWGIPLEKEEYEYMGIRRYKLVKGIIKGSELIVGVGVKRGLITAKSEREIMMVPLLKAGKKKKKGK